MSIIKDLDNHFTDINTSFYSDTNLISDSDENAINNAIDNIIFTKPGERVGDPEFGCKASELLFDQMSFITEHLLHEIIEDAITKYEPRIDLNNVEVTAEPDKNYYSVLITYDIIKSRKTDSKYTTVLKRL